MPPIFSRRLADLLALAGLCLLVAVFFWKIALTNLILVGVDIFTYFYPYRAAINDAISQGRLPLWNPYLFMGAPLLANGQAGLFYPLNWPLALLDAPRAINASIVLHVALAAGLLFAFARDRLALPTVPAVLAAVVFALGGYAGSLVEHVNQLQAAAWFPLLLLCADRAMEGRGWRWAVAGGIVFGIQLLAGHAQVSFISVFGCGLWILGRWGDATASLRQWLHTVRRHVVQWPLRAVLVMGIIGATGAALAAVQLLPMAELSRLSIRGGGMTYREAVAFSLPPGRLIESLLPTYGMGVPVFSEYVAFVGVAAGLLALLGVGVAWRQHPGLTLLLAGGLALALGVFDPLYYLLFKLAPGFGLFRAPARWLFLSAFAAGGFAGIGLAYARNGSLAGAWKPLARALVAAGIIMALAAGLVLGRLFVMPPPAVVWPWLFAGMLCVALLFAPRLPVRLRQTLLLGTVAIELYAATRWLPYNQPTAPEAFSALRPAIAFLLSEDQSQPWRVLSYSDLTWDPGDLRDIRDLFGDALPPQSIYEYTVAVKAKEIIAPNLPLRYGIQSVDGYDGGILPLARYVGLQSLFLTPEQVNPDGRLRERLRSVPDSRWLDLFNVRYVIADKIFDVWVDGVYYDLGLGATLPPGRTQTVDAPGDFEATGLGVVSYLNGAVLVADGTPVADVTVTFADGREQAFVLRAGHDTAESAASPTGARAVHTLRDRPDAREYHSLLTFAVPGRPVRVTTRSLLPQGDLVLHGMTLVHAPTTTGRPLVVADAGRFRLAHSGDVKIYEKTDSAPRALVVHRAQILADDGRSLDLMRLPGFEPSAQIVLAGGSPMDGSGTPTAASVDTYLPERIVMRTSDSAEGYLLVKDAWYPGWRAWVDGQEAPIERADTFFRAVRLPGGAHTIEMRYESATLAMGALVTGAAMLVLGVLAMAAWRR
ncbi:MAG: YfhO family protein [Chloroflexi bacterium]|nr:YfhO family protein [Chloroflexota bacterium]